MTNSFTTPARRRIVSLAAAAVAAGALLAFSGGTAQAVAPEVISRWDNDVLHANSIGAAANLGFPAAPYTITAKLTAENLGSSTIQNYTCQLSAEAGADTDFSSVTLAPGAQQTMLVHVVHTFSGTGLLTFACTKPAGSPQVRIKQLKITGIKVNAIDNQPVNLG